MIEKIVIIIILSVYYYDVQVKSILIFMIISIYAILSNYVQPYTQKQINKLDTYSTTVCSLSVLLANFLYRNPHSYFFYIAFIILFIINVWFAFLMLVYIAKEYISKVK